MKVILNSDILFDKQLVVNSVSRKLQHLLEICRDNGHLIVLPFTALLEFQRAQKDLIPGEKSRLEDAYQRLERFKIDFVRVEPSTIIKVPDLVAVMRATGAKIRVEKPTLEDFEDAHRRACLHECPHMPERKSDEMRDLVIWNMALRLAKLDNGAILIAKDKLFTHERGDNEASEASLVRVEDIDDAVDYLDDRTVGAHRIRQLLDSVWYELVATPLPLNPEMTHVHIYRVRFTQGEGQVARASAQIQTQTTTGGVLNAEVQFSILENTVTRVALTDVSVPDAVSNLPDVSIECSALVPVEPDDYQQRLVALRAIMGGKS